MTNADWKAYKDARRKRIIKESIWMAAAVALKAASYYVIFC